MDRDEYYKEELRKIDTQSKYPPTIKLSSTKGETKWMDLNPISAKVFIEWLQENFPE